MSGYTEIVNTLHEIRNFLQERMTPQFINTLQAATEAIQRTLNDPNLQANLRASLSQLNLLLENINQQNVVGQLSAIATQLRTIVQTIDPQAINSIIDSLNNLLTSANQAGLVENINHALESVSSLSELVNIAHDLALPARVFIYGSTGAIIGTALTNTIQSYLQHKKDRKLQESIDRLVALNAQQLYVEIQQLRTNAGQFLLNYETALRQHPNMVLPIQLTNLRDEQILILNVLSPIDINHLELMEKAQRFGEKMLEVLYQTELNNEPMSDYLDRVSEDTASWHNVVEYVAHHPNYQILSKKQKPELPRDDLNYSQIKKLYGAQPITKIMNSLVKQFESHGGDELFYELANSSVNTSYWLGECLKHIIVQENMNLNENIPGYHGIQRLKEIYHNHAAQHISEQWDNTSWNHLPPHKRALTERVSRIIRTRALVQLCHQLAPGLCFPRNVPREIWNGTVDIPRGVYQLVRHPVNSLSNLGRTFFTINGWRSLGESIVSHPVRFLTTQSLSMGAASMGTRALAHSNTATRMSAMIRQPSLPTSVMTRSLCTSTVSGALNSRASEEQEQTEAHPSASKMTSSEAVVLGSALPFYAELIKRLGANSNDIKINDFYVTFVDAYRKHHPTQLPYRVTSTSHGIFEHLRTVQSMVQSHEKSAPTLSHQG